MKEKQNFISYCLIDGNLCKFEMFCINNLFKLLIMLMNLYRLKNASLVSVKKCWPGFSGQVSTKFIINNQNKRPTIS